MRTASRSTALPAFCLIALLWAAPVALRAQFGTVELTTVIPTEQFAPNGTSLTFFNEGFTYIQATSGNPATFFASTGLPPGAKVNQFCLIYRDNDAVANVNMDLAVIEFGNATNGGPSLTALGSVSSTGSPGYDVVCATPTLSTTVRAFADGDGDGKSSFLSYRVSVSMVASDELAFGGVAIKWQRQQAPAPAVATFADVPTNFLFFRAIENLAAAGITGGCAPGNYCPNANITRGEAAAFFSKALGLNWPQ